MKLIALKHLRRKGPGPRIESGSEFDSSEVENPGVLVSAGHARAVEEVKEDEPSREELYERAKTLGVKGRSSMTKEELEAAVNDPQARAEWMKKQKAEGRSK